MFKKVIIILIMFGLLAPGLSFGEVSIEIPKTIDEAKKMTDEVMADAEKELFEILKQIWKDILEWLESIWNTIWQKIQDLLGKYF